MPEKYPPRFCLGLDGLNDDLETRFSLQPLTCKLNVQRISASQSLGFQDHVWKVPMAASLVSYCPSRLAELGETATTKHSDQLAGIHNSYTVYHQFGGRRFVCFVFGPWHWLDQNQNTRNVYFQTDDKWCRYVARRLHASQQRQQWVRHTPKAQRHLSAIPWPLVLAISCPTVPTCPIQALYLIPTA